MAKRDTPNTYFSWYNDDDRLAVVVRQESSDSSKGTTSGEYDTYLDSTVSNGIQLTIHAKYEELTEITDDLQVDAKLDSVMHTYVLDYVKSRILEDMGQMEVSQYFRKRFHMGIAKKPSRKSGVRSLAVPNL